MTQYGLKEKAFDDHVAEVEGDLEILILNAEIELLKLKIRLLQEQKQILAQGE